MKLGAELRTKRLILRHWTGSEDDRHAFYLLNADETVMKYFPHRRTRAESDAMLERIRAGTAKNGMGFAAVCLASTGEPIGFSGVAPVDYFEAKFTPAVEIGWRLMPAFWGKGYATEAAVALLHHGFKDLGLDRIVAFAVPANTASVNVMKRIGMKPNPTYDFMHPNVPDTHPHLKNHVFYEAHAAHEKGGT